MSNNKAISFITKSSNQGYSIMEVMFAMAIFAIGILAIATMQQSSANGNKSAAVQTEAANLATAQIESLMNLPYANLQVQDVDNDGTGGLDDIGAANADGTSTTGQYSLSWNVAVDSPMNNTLTIRVIVVDSSQKQTIITCFKADTI